jgi:hypothetical protein
MGHRISVLLTAVIGGTIAFTLFLGMVASSLGPPVPAGAEAAPAPAARTGGDTRQSLARILETLDAKVAQWRQDHGGAHPDFDNHPEWEQFLQQTDSTGAIAGAVRIWVPPVPATAPASTTAPAPATAPAATTFGPYLKAVPVNPGNNLSNVARVDGPVRPGFRLQTGRAGFVYSVADGRFWGTNAVGRGVVTLVPPAQQPAPSPQ